MGVLFPFDPTWANDVTIQRSYMTEIITSRGFREQRIANRKDPRTTVDFDMSFGGPDLAAFRAYMSKNLQGTFSLPEWTRWAATTADAAIGTLTLTVGRVPAWVRVAQEVYVVAGLVKRRMTVVDKTLSTITFDGAFDVGWPTGTRIHPLMEGVFDQTLGNTLLTNQAGRVKATFISNPPTYTEAEGLVGRRLGAFAGYYTTFESTVIDVSDIAEEIDAGLKTMTMTAAARCEYVGLGGTGPAPYYLEMNGVPKDAADAAIVPGYIPGEGLWKATKNTAGDDTVSIFRTIPPGTRKIEMWAQIVATFPIFSSFGWRGKTWEVKDVVEDAEYYNGREVFLTKPNWANDIPAEILGYLETTDFGRGMVAHFSPIGFNTRRFQPTFMFRDNHAADQFLSFFERNKGMRGEFYMPTWEPDVSLQIGATAGQTRIDVPGVGFLAAYAGSTVYRNIIAFYRDGTHEIKQIAGVAETVGDTRISLTAAWSRDVNPTTTKLVCLLPVSRFSTDDLSLVWVTNQVATAKTTLQTLEDL